MNIDVQRKIDLIVGIIICRIISLFSCKQKAADHHPKKILVILLSEMGSLVLARPMFDELKQDYPEAEIYGLLFEQNCIMLELIGVVPKENIITVRNTSFLKLLISSLSALLKLHRIEIDTAIDCELFSRISSILSFFSGAKVRVGFHRHKQEGLYRGDFINRPVLYNPYNHISQQFVTLAKAIRSENKPLVKRVIQKTCMVQSFIQFPHAEIAHYRNKFCADFPDVLDRKFILLYPSGGQLPIRAWPLDNYCRLSKILISRGYAVGIIGTLSDKEFATSIQTHCKDMNCIDLTGYTETIKELMLMFHFASLLITNDGGPGHFAAMTPISSIIFYGPETPVLYGPISSNTCIFYRALACSPCLTAYNHRNSPCDGDNQCLQGISVEDVMNKVEEFIKNE